MTSSSVELPPFSDVSLFVIGLITLMQFVVWYREHAPGMAWFAGGSLACTVLVGTDALPESPATLPGVVALLTLYAIRGAYAIGLGAQLAVPPRTRAIVVGVLALPAIAFALALAAGFPMARLPVALPLLWTDLGLAAVCIVFAWREPAAGRGLLTLAPLLGPAPALLDPWRGSGPFLRHDFPLSAISFGIVVVTVCLMRSARDSRHAQALAQRIADYYAALSHTNQAILRIRLPSTLYEEVCRICVDSGHAQLACVYVLEGQLAHRVAQAGPGAALLDRVPNPWDISTPEARGTMTAQSLTKGIVVVSHDYLNDPRSAPWRESARAHGLRTLACLPLRRAGQVAGVLMLAASEVGFFDERLLALLSEMIADISFALDNIDRDTAHLESTRQVEAGLARFTQLFQAAPVAAAILSMHDRRVVAVNDAMCTLQRMSRHDMIGRLTTELTYTVLPEDREYFYRLLREQGRVRNLLARMVDASGDIRQELMNAESIDYLGQACILYMSMDITDVHRAEQAREALDAAQAANQAKTEFLARMSHELRTPLNAVLGFSALVRRDAESRLTRKERSHLDHVQQAGWHLLGLINDVLDLSRIEAGQFGVEVRRLELGPVLDEALNMSSPLAVDSAIALVADYRDEPRFDAIADPTRLRQVVLNVLTNAIKYNRPEGAVHVHLLRRANRTVIEVTDTGIGMTPRQLDQLFEPFNRLGREGQGIDGSGIGMALSRQLMWMMDGEVEVSSEPGRGTRILLSLPLAETESPPRPSAHHPSVPESAAADEPLQGRVLYIEDNDVNTQLVQALLARWSGVQFLSAQDGATGIRLARSTVPDLILLDMQLPDIDGLQVLQALSADPGVRRIPVIVLSATAGADEIASARHAGATDYWTKPLDYERFLTGISTLLRAVRSRAET